MAASTYTGIDYIKTASSVEKFNLLAICSKDIFLRKKMFLIIEKIKKVLGVLGPQEKM